MKKNNINNNINNNCSFIFANISLLINVDEMNKKQEWWVKSFDSNYVNLSISSLHLQENINIHACDYVFK